MDESRKAAYRFLLYWSFLEIRAVQWFAWGPRTWLNPFRFAKEIKKARRLGGLADWMHNLAQFSSLGFRGFDEDRFWEDGQCFVRHDPSLVRNYSDLFEQQLADKTSTRSIETKMK